MSGAAPAGPGAAASWPGWWRGRGDRGGHLLLEFAAAAGTAAAAVGSVPHDADGRVHHPTRPGAPSPSDDAGASWRRRGRPGRGLGGLGSTAPPAAGSPAPPTASAISPALTALTARRLAPARRQRVAPAGPRRRGRRRFGGGGHAGGGGGSGASPTTPGSARRASRCAARYSVGCLGGLERAGSARCTGPVPVRRGRRLGEAGGAAQAAGPVGSHRRVAGRRTATRPAARPGRLGHRVILLRRGRLSVAPSRALRVHAGGSGAADLGVGPRSPGRRRAGAGTGRLRSASTLGSGWAWTMARRWVQRVSATNSARSRCRRGRPDDPGRLDDHDVVELEALGPLGRHAPRSVPWRPAARAPRTARRRRGRR